MTLIDCIIGAGLWVFMWQLTARMVFKSFKGKANTYPFGFDEWCILFVLWPIMFPFWLVMSMLSE